MTPAQIKDATSGMLESILKRLDARGNVLNQLVREYTNELEDISEEAQEIRSELKRRKQ